MYMYIYMYVCVWDKSQKERENSLYTKIIGTQMFQCSMVISKQQIQMSGRE